MKYRNRNLLLVATIFNLKFCCIFEDLRFFFQNVCYNTFIIFVIANFHESGLILVFVFVVHSWHGIKFNPQCNFPWILLALGVRADWRFVLSSQVRFSILPNFSNLEIFCNITFWLFFSGYRFPWILLSFRTQVFEYWCRIKFNLQFFHRFRILKGMSLLLWYPTWLQFSLNLVEFS